MLNESQLVTPIVPASDGKPPEEWLGGVHPDGQLEVTSGFHLHADKLSRVLTYLQHERQADGSVYVQLAEATGMSRSQVKAFMQYGVYMELLQPHSLRVTPLGRLVLQCDPFFDRTVTLWLLHYAFASNPMLVVWNYMCNSVLPAVAEIGKVEAAEQFLPFVGRWTEDTIRKNIRKELRAFFADYTEAMFAPLEYLREIREGVYMVNRQVASVQPATLLAMASIYRDRHLPGATAIPIPMLVYGEHSPGRIARQSEAAIRRGLDELHQRGLAGVEMKANLDQLRLRSDKTWLNAARMAYEEQGRGSV